MNNRLSRINTSSFSIDAVSPDTLSYDAANQLLNFNSITFNYDANGNRTQKIDGNTNTIYIYDDENRLTRVEITGGTTSVITYAYDPFGRRIEKNVNGTITKYLYDKEAILLEYDQVGAVQTRYTHGPGIDEPFAMEKNSQIYYYHADGLGSIVALTNASGTVAQAYTYDSFGNITSGTPTITQPYTYTAREYDTETGLYFYRARYYDPKAGRFITRDPISFRGGDVNLYAYVKNNPVNWTDPEGTQTATWPIVIPWIPVIPIIIPIIINPVTVGVGVCIGIIALTANECNKDEAQCEKMNQIDTSTCNGITKVRGGRAGARCHASASQRYAECLRSGPGGVRTPLDTWNN